MWIGKSNLITATFSPLRVTEVGTEYYHKFEKSDSGYQHVERDYGVAVPVVVIVKFTSRLGG
jgi:hypothetical protein